MGVTLAMVLAVPAVTVVLRLLIRCSWVPCLLIAAGSAVLTAAEPRLLAAAGLTAGQRALVLDGGLPAVAVAITAARFILDTRPRPVPPRLQYAVRELETRGWDLGRGRHPWLCAEACPHVHMRTAGAREVVLRECAGDGPADPG